VTRPVRLALVAATVALAAPACGGGGAAGTSTPSATQAPAADHLTADDFSPDLFDRARSATVDHRWFPLVPGRRLAFAGKSTEDGEVLAHRVVFIVTDLVKEIAGVRTVVVWERDYLEGELVEAEIVFFAEDEAGNVWHFGQHPEEYERGKLVKSPTWIAGLKGAKPGIMMRATPELGSPDYSQGFAPKPINWVDRGRVYKVGTRTCVPAGCYDDVLVTEEFELDKPDAFQLKYYAPDVGNVRVGWRGHGEKQRENLALVAEAKLTPDGLAEARAAALRLEATAYRISKDVYGQTEPAQPRSG
jgi:hypothetical protein